MNNDKTYHGSCFCGAVKFIVTGEPAAMGYCRCEASCRWAAEAVNAFALWKPESLRITQGANNIGSYNKTEHSARKWCKSCGGHLFTDHPHWQLTDVYAGVIEEFPYQAGERVDCREDLLNVRDESSTRKRWPVEMSDSNVATAE